MLQADYLVLADAAQAVQGKHFILGAGWDTLFGTAFPVTHPSLGVALRLMCPWNDTNQPHQIEIDVIDEDGRSILPTPPGPMVASVNVGRPPNIRLGTDQPIVVAVTLVGLQFQGPGLYSVVIRSSGTELRRSSFSVATLPGMPVA